MGVRKNNLAIMNQPHVSYSSKLSDFKPMSFEFDFSDMTLYGINRFTGKHQKIIKIVRC